jgi:hypothetical protein
MIHTVTLCKRAFKVGLGFERIYHVSFKAICLQLIARRSMRQGSKEKPNYAAECGDEAENHPKL